MSDDVIRDAVERSIRAYEEELGHETTITRDMVGRHGEVEALSRLMISADLQRGFRALRDANRLDETFEKIVVTHPDIFTKEGVVESAQWRLDNPNWQ